MNTLAKIGIMIFVAIYIGIALAIAVMFIGDYLDKRIAKIRRQYGVKER